MSFMDQMIAPHLSQAHDKADAIIAQLADHSDRLATIAENTEAQVLRKTYQRVPFVGTADAGGNVVIPIQVPQGIGWDLVSFSVIGTAAGNFAIYLGNVDGTGLVYAKAVPATPFRLADIFAGEEYAPAGGQITIAMDGQTPSQDVRGNLKVNVLAEGAARMRS